MVVMFKMTPEKKEKYIKKTDKMIELLEEFKECLEDSEDFDGDEDWEDENPQFQLKAMMRKMMKSGMKSRYGKKMY